MYNEQVTEHKKSTVALNEEEQIQIAEVAEKAERYDDMVNAMKNLAMSKRIEFTQKEKNLLSVGYKNVMDSRRSAWRNVSEFTQKSKENAAVKQQLQNIEKEIRDICHEVLTLLDKFLIPNTSTAEGRVFFGKMKGDYHRYLAEILVGDEQKRISREGQKLYDETFDFAKQNLEAAHPVRLGTALNISVFYYDILKNETRACALAQEAFDDAIALIDVISEDFYKDSTLIMQLLRDNIKLWSTDS